MNFVPTSLAVAVLAACIAGCASEPFIDTPYVMYGEPGKKVFDHTFPAARTPDVRVFYFTDRAAERVSGRGLEYGYTRGASIDYGTATVSLADGVTWDQLVTDSTTGVRSRSYSPRVTKIDRAGGIPATMTYLDVVDGRLARKPDAIADIKAEQARICEELRPWLESTDRKEAVVFIHGFNNSFDDSILRLAQAWHFTGRQGIPIVYSWPAGAPGLLAYAHDRESGEFTIVHLKLLLATLAACPQIEKIQILSHSRGTDVAVTALRELNAEVRGADGTGLLSQVLNLNSPAAREAVKTRPIYQTLKIDTLILAAPDLDAEVFSQRFFGENMLQCVERLVVYFSEEDKALAWAEWLFSGRRGRLGAMKMSDFTPEQRTLIAQLPCIQLIECNLTGYSSHSYFTQHPSALSDVLLLLQGDCPPGAKYGRPLGVPFPGAWSMDDNYLRPTHTPTTGQLNTPP